MVQLYLVRDEDRADTRADLEAIVEEEPFHLRDDLQEIYDVFQSSFLYILTRVLPQTDPVNDYNSDVKNYVSNADSFMENEFFTGFHQRFFEIGVSLLNIEQETHLSEQPGDLMDRIINRLDKYGIVVHEGEHKIKVSPFTMYGKLKFTYSGKETGRSYNPLMSREHSAFRKYHECLTDFGKTLSFLSIGFQKLGEHDLRRKHQYTELKRQTDQLLREFRDAVINYFSGMYRR